MHTVCNMYYEYWNKWMNENTTGKGTEKGKCRNAEIENIFVEQKKKKI